MLLSRAPSNIINSGFGTYGNSGQFWACNQFGGGSFKAGAGSQIMSINSDIFPANTTTEWTWPNDGAFAGGQPYGFALLAYGLQFGGDAFGTSPPVGTPLPTPTQLTAFTALTATFSARCGGDLTIDNGSFNLFFELWPSTAAGAGGHHVTHEVSVFLHSQTDGYAFWGPGGSGGFTNFTYNSPTYNATVVADNVTFNPPRIMVFPFNNTDYLTGSIDFKDLLAFIVSKGLLDGTNYLNGIELGVEPGANSGYSKISRLNIDWR